MQKKPELDIPVDDLDAWARYPKHRWVYEASRLLDAQNIKWSPVETAEYSTEFDNLVLYSDGRNHQSGKIYIQEPVGRTLFSEVYLVKGEIKHIRHIDPKTGEQLPDLIGELELRISAFVSLYFTRFSGVISCHSHGSSLYRIKLRLCSELGLKDTIETNKLTKRIYRKNTNLSLNGLTDRAAQEAHAS